MNKEMKDQAPLFSSPRNRVFAATIGVLLTSIITSAGMPLYLPLSRADSLGLPIIGFPIIWLSLFLSVLFIKKLWRAWTMLIGLSAVHILLIFLMLKG